MAAQMCLVDGDLIQPDLIPGADIDPATLAGSATGFSTAGTAVTEKGAAVVTQWAGLSGVYVAPESAELLEVMAPVAVDSAALGQTFASVSTILANFADDVAPVKSRLAIIREEARAFVARVSDGVTVDIWDGDHPAYNAGVLSFMVTDFADMGPAVITWREHKPSVEENKDLIHRVNVEVAALDTVRVDCVNAINALRTDVCVVDAVALTVADLDGEGVSLPWGAATDGDRSCSESFGDGIADSAVGMWEGGGALLSYNSDTGQWGDGQLAGQVWSGLGMTVAGLALVGPISILSMTVPKSSVPGWLHGTQDFVNGSQEALFAAGKGIVAADKWAENPAEAAGTALLNIGTFFIPGGAVVGGVKAGMITARVSSIVGHAIDVVLPGVTVVTRAGGAVLHVGQGLTVLTDLAKTGLFSGVSTGRAALAQALHSIADQIPVVHIEPGYTAVTPDGAVGFGAPPHLAVGEAGSGGSALHSIADRVAPPAAAAAPPVAAHVDAHVDVTPTPTADAPAGAIDDVAPHAAPDGPGSGGASNGSEPDGFTSENAGTGEASGSDLDPNAGIGTAPVQADFQVPGTTKTIDYVAYHETLAASVHNADALEVMLGKWDGGRQGNYVEMGEAGGYEYFSLGADWDPIKKAQGLDDSDMFSAYNMPFLDDGIASGKTFHFSHDPRFDEGALFREFKYLEATGYRYDPAAMTALPRSARL